MQKEMTEIYSKKLLQRKYSNNTQKTYLSLFKKYIIELDNKNLLQQGV